MMIREIETAAVNKVVWLTWLYRKPWVAALFVPDALSGGYLAYNNMQTGFLPDLDEGTIVLDYHSPSGTDIGETDRMCRQMEDHHGQSDVGDLFAAHGFGHVVHYGALQLRRLSHTAEERSKHTTPG